MTLQKQLEYSNIPAWHRAGYTGKGIVVLNLESASSDHCKACTQRIKDAAPDCIVYEIGATVTTKNGIVTATGMYDGKKLDMEEIIQRSGARILTKSTGGKVTDAAKSKYWNALKDKYNLIFFTSAGNEGSADIGGAFPDAVAMYIGACSISGSGAIVRKNYSSIGKEVDFVNFTGYLEGTSFAAPYTAGMAALVLQRWPDMTHDHVYAYLKSISKDLDDTGHDIFTGWGVPVLGNPETMITMWIGKDYMSVDGRQVTLDQAPQIVKETGRTLVPIRAIAEALGAKVEWDEKTKKITIVR